jgi:hypothetical protein
MSWRRLSVWSLLLLLAVALVSTTVSDRALGQGEQPPTKAPLPQAPTKPPVEMPPTKAPAKPTALPPTKVASTALPTKELATNTPESIIEPTKTPIGLVPSKTIPPKLPTTPSGPPTQSVGYGQTPLPVEATAPVSASTNGHEPGPISGTPATPSLKTAVTPTQAEPSVLSGSSLIGVVFEDDNGNGVQDANESGLSGIAVIVEVQGQQHTLITDASGAYQAPANPQATARVIPPAGWQVTGEAVMPLDRARHFPLRPRATDRSISVPAVTSSVINLTSVALGFVGLGAIIWLGLLQHQRARVNSFNAWARADLRLRSEAERQARRERIEIDGAWIVALLNQAALDATGDAPGIDQIDRVVLEPIPALVGLGCDFQRLIFTPAPESIVRQLVKRKALVNLLGESLRGVRAYPIDALNGDLFVADDLAAAFAAKVPQPVGLPRTERWSVYVVATPRGKVAR